jgi:hypothetical protein
MGLRRELLEKWAQVDGNKKGRRLMEAPAFALRAGRGSNDPAPGLKD